MTKVMPKGSNTPLTAVDAVRAVLRWRVAPGVPDIDVVALLLGHDGKVRGEEDFVFYNQPRHPSGQVRLIRPKARVGEEMTNTIDIDLSRLPDDVERVVVGGSAEGGNFGQVPGLCILLYDIAGGPHVEPLARFDITDATMLVTAMLCGEIYRRSGGWKFRAIGQGYSSGLDGLATDFGVPLEPSAEPAAEEGPESRSETEPTPPDPQPQPPAQSQAQGQAQAQAPAQAQPAYGYPQPLPPPMPQHRPLLPAPEGFTLPPQGPQFLSNR